MSDDLPNSAIRAALSGNWAEAVEINKAILKDTPKNLEALNRLAKAHMELGQKNPAQKTLKTALSIDPYNQISLKLKAKLATGKIFLNGKADHFASLSAFIEEPGKTKTVLLINCASPKKISCAECAQGLQLVPKRHTVHVCDCDGNYLGMLPDDLGKRLNLLIKGGNTYDSFVKSVGGKDLVIFIRETSRTKKFRDLPSFPSKVTNDYIIDRADEILAEEEGKLQKPKNLPAGRQGVETPDDEDDDLPGAKVIHLDEVPEE